MWGVVWRQQPSVELQPPRVGLVLGAVVSGATASLVTERLAQLGFLGGSCDRALHAVDEPIVDADVT